MTPDEITALRRAAETPVSAAMADVPVIAADLSAEREVRAGHPVVCRD